MKNIPLLLILISTSIYSQKIKKNEVDEFTGNKVIETSWDAIRKGGTYSYTRFRKIDNDVILDFKDVTKKVVGVKEGASFMLKLSNDEIVKLKTLSHEVSSRGGGAVGLSYSNVEGIGFSIKINEEDFKKILSSNVKKLRYYTNDGYVEYDIKEKLALKFIKQASLVK